MKKIVLISLGLITHSVLAQKPIFSEAKVTSAIVYFNSVELTHTTGATLPKGMSEVVIKNVANSLDPNTITISAPKNVTILSSQFTQAYLSEYEIDETSPAIKRVRDSIALLDKEIKSTQNRKATESKSVELLDKNQVVSGTNSGLNVAELYKMVDFYTSKRNKLLENIDALDTKEKNLIKIREQLKARLDINSAKEGKSSNGKIILQVMSDASQRANFQISYISRSAGWSPFYDLTIANINAPIQLFYKAQVFQNTGVDWRNVKLRLSSGNATENNNYPVLQPWHLRYSSPTAAYSGYKKMALERTAKMVARAEVADQMEVSSISDYVSIAQNQLSVSFEIDVLYDILSNGKAHSVSMSELKLPAQYKYYAAPRADNDAFLLAEIDDYSQYNLLSGEANIIFEQMYVGKTTINPNQTSEELKLSVGRDKRISIKRNKIADKSGTKFLSNYKEQTFTYDIVVRNNKKEAISLTLQDQYPLSSDKDITIELVESSKAEVNTETGMLTWEVKLKPNETKTYRISYKVKYPKDKTLDNL